VAYTVLARRYRSRTFDEVIGQEPIATTLVNAIKTGRVHHGYLFTGTRGVGKTSMARILAKALNCLSADAPTTAPCCECDACKAIAEGQDIDVVEIDAASNTGVDNIRELRSNAAYRPARARFKIYIIDEVHMLSTGAFNALLKTLEEPPEHVKFILATTEVQKVPATIQSRCQRFNFRNISPEAIARRLADIATAEGTAADDAVVRRIARLANGSMRDGLSILDQLISVSPEKLTPQVLDEILPPAQDEQTFALIQHAARGDVSATLLELDAILSGGRGLELLCNDLIELIRSLLLLRACGADTPLADVPAAARSAYAELANAFELSQYVQMIGMLEELRRNVRYSGAGRALTEAALVRLARMKEWAAIEALLAEVAPAGATADQKKKAAASPPLNTPAAVRGGSEGSGRVGRGGAVQRAAAPAQRSRFQSSDGGRSDRPEVGPPGVGDAAQVADESPGLPDDETPPPASADAPRWSAGGVSIEQRRRAMQDPVVRQLQNLFDGTLVNVRDSGSGQSVLAGETPSPPRIAGETFTPPGETPSPPGETPVRSESKTLLKSSGTMKSETLSPPTRE